VILIKLVYEWTDGRLKQIFTEQNAYDEHRSEVMRKRYTGHRPTKIIKDELEIYLSQFDSKSKN